MNTRVVSISRQVGTIGEDVARLSAERLGFRYIDYQVIQAAAREAGVSPETVSEAEHPPSLLTTKPLYTSTDYRTFIEDVIRDVAQEGNCLVVGHAAQVILRERFDTLHVLITGSPTFRARRIMAGMNVDEKTALKTVDRTDNERLDYFRRFYDTGWLTPCTYDLCINTDHLNPEQAAELVVQAALLR